MKKITLFFVAMLFSALSFAALNPYAYGLSSTLDGTTLTVNYSLNSAATSVNVVIMDGAEEVKTVTCNDKISKGSHSVEISTIGLPTNKSLTWKVVVTGNSVASPTLQSDVFNFYLPYGMDVDVDPESDYLGNWYVIEARNDAQGKAGKEHYQSYNVGRALYAFDAALQPKKNKNGQYGFTGGVYLGASQATHSSSSSIVNLYRVTTSGGRVFIGKFEPNYTPVVEVNPNDLDANFTEVIPAGKRAVSIDAIGRGENLKLVMLDTDFNLTEYDLGTKSSISSASRTINKGALSIVRNDATIVYDNEGGIWLNQHRATATATCPTIAHISAKNGFDYNNIDGGVAHNNTNNSGIAISPDGKQLAVVGAGTQKLTIYNISKTDGQIKLTKAHTISTSGSNHTALSWDYAGNLYVANRSAETITFYAMPYSGTVSTPCASKYAFEVEEIVANVYTLTTNVVGEGTVEGNEGSYVEGTTATLTATPAAHYDFLNWTYGSETSTDNPLTITVNSDLTVTANFQEHTKYTITASAANNAMGYVTGGGTYYAGETVTLKATAKTGYYFTSWSDSNAENPRTFTATEDLTLQANFAKAYPRVYAYDLNVVDNGDSYTFSFKPNTDAISGNLLLYSEDGTSVIQTHAITTAIVAHTTTTITLNKEDLPNPADIPWAIGLSGNPIPAFAETFADADYRFAKGHAAVDNSPESEYFGRVYVADRRSTKANSGLYVYNTDLTQLNAEAYKLGMSAAGYSRPAVGADGTVYLTGYTDDESGIFVVDPADLTKCTQFYDGTRAGSGLFTNGGVEIGSSTSGVGAYGVGKDAVLYSMMEDGTGANAYSGKQPIVKYQIGQEDGTVLKQWSTAPTWHINYPATGKDTYNFGNNAFAATEKGVWISQNKSNDADRPEIAFIDKDGVIQFMQNLNKSQGAGLAVNADNTVLYLQKASEILEYTIAWTGNTPALTLANTYPVSLQHITTLSLDYAGNLIACAGTQYGNNTDNNVMKLVAYTLPTNDNTCIVPAAKSKVLKLGNRYNVEVALNDNAMGRATGAGEYKEGVTATFIATPNYGYRFLNWTYGGETSTNNPLELIVESDLTITANFEPIQYTISAPTNDENKGTVTGAGTYSYGTEVTLTATPKDGYKLLYWSDRSTENPRIITMTKNEALSAYFVKKYDEEPTFTITKLWENTNVPASTNNGFQAIGWDQKIYMKDRGNKQILVFSDATTSATYVATDDKDDQPIAIDDAGNIIIRSGSGFFYNAPTQVTIYKNGNKTGKVIDFTLPASGRCDFISASGDIYSAEGGYVYFYCQNQTTVSRLYIKNGGASAADVSVDKLDNATLTAGSSQSHVFTNIFGDLMTHTRDNNYKVLQEVNVLTGAVSTMNLPNFKKSTLGGCSFELGGKELIAYNIAGTDYNSEWNIYNMTDKQFLSNETLYAKDKVSRKNSGASNWLNVQVVDENTAYIYQFCPEVAVAVWKVSLVRNDLENFTITATANNALMGSIVGSGEYYEGGTAMLTANAYPGFRFVNWTKGGVEVSTDATYLFTVTEDVELVANFEVILLDTENNAGILTNLNDQTVDVAVYRSLTAGMYNTLCLPFRVDDISGTPLENTTVWKYNGAEVKGEGDSKEIFLEFTEVISLEAGQPYLVEPAAEIEAPMVFNGVTISAINGSEVAQSAVTMHGILHPTKLQANNKSILFLVENNNLAWANVTAYMNGMRAYFQVNEPSLQSARTRAYIKRTPTVATGMENTEYNPQENNTRKIIYNNTIYILRGDEVYTIQGTKVK